MTPKGDSRSLATFPKVYPQGSHKYGEDGRLQGWVNVPAVWQGRRVGCEYLRVLPLGSWSSFATNVTMGTRCSPTWNTPFSSHKVTDNSPPPLPSLSSCCSVRLTVSSFRHHPPALRLPLQWEREAGLALHGCVSFLHLSWTWRRRGLRKGAHGGMQEALNSVLGTKKG